MAGESREAKSAIDALYTLADAISEQRIILRDMRQYLKELVDLWRSSSAAEPSGTPPAADVDEETSPDQGEQQQQPTESSSDRMVRMLITQQLGIDPRELQNMSEEEMLLKVASLKNGQNGAGGAPPGNTTT